MNRVRRKKARQYSDVGKGTRQHRDATAQERDGTVMPKHGYGNARYARGNAETEKEQKRKTG